MKKMMMMPALCLMMACASPELTNEQVIAILKEEQVYPKPAEYLLNLADQAAARQALDAGLEDQGLIKVRKTWTMMNEADPYITFTEKARPYLRGTYQGEDSTKMRYVLMSTRTINEVTKIEKRDDKHAVASFTVRHIDTTPFQRLTGRDIKVLQNDFAEFELVDGKWRLDKKEGK